MLMISDITYKIRKSLQSEILFLSVYQFITLHQGHLIGLEAVQLYDGSYGFLTLRLKLNR